jgi:hypothetical protein
MVIHSPNSLDMEMPLLLSAFSNITIHNVTCGRPIGREFGASTQTVSSQQLRQLLPCAVEPNLWAASPQPKEESDCDSNYRCQECANGEEDYR